MKRVLVVAASGMLGHALCHRLVEAGMTVFATTRGPYAGTPGLAPAIAPEAHLGSCDVRDEARLAAAIAAAAPEVVVNCAGVIKQRRESQDAELTIAVNALAPHRLARLAAEAGARLITLSTDCVFSGRRGLYTENDLPDPPDLYGRSKLLGEVVEAPHLTLRTSIIGWQLAGSEGLAEWFRAQAGRRAEGWTGAVFSGLTTYALSGILATLIERHPALTGLYHVAAAPITKFDLLDRLNRAARLGVDLVRVEGLRIDRSLDGSRFTASTGLKAPDWDEMLREMAEKRKR